MFSIRSLAAAMMVNTAFFPSHVHSKEDSKPHGFYGNGEAGYNSNAGSTNNTSFYGAVKLNYREEDYELKSIFEINYKTANKVQTQERYQADLQRNQFYNSEQNYYSFVSGQFERNHLEEIDLDATALLGLGKNIYKTENTLLIGEMGIGYQSISYTVAEEKSTKNQNQITGRLKLDFTHKINDIVNFTQNIIYFTRIDHTKIETNTGFKIKVANNMGVKIAYKYRYNNKPAINIKTTNTQSSVTLIYDF
ncbi:MAG: DUF481 domain-containing protein [Thiomicrorhabdus sp.]|nr:DUF481 domain-containing protein [Thiomicrorhabdus sp.]